MTERLVVGVLGNQDSGKSKTWYTLFGTKVKTARYPHWLELRPGQWVKVVLINGSPEETGLDLNKKLDDEKCPIVLCSMQYINTVDTTVHKTLDYFIDRGYTLYIQWLNPGKSDQKKVREDPTITKKIMEAESVFSTRDGKLDPARRVQEIKEFIFGWAKYRHPRFS